jgi:hypothetical protein
MVEQRASRDCGSIARVHATTSSGRTFHLRAFLVCRLPIVGAVVSQSVVWLARYGCSGFCSPLKSCRSAAGLLQREPPLVRS